MYHILLTLAYQEKAITEINNFLESLKNIELRQNDGLSDIFDEYQTDKYNFKILQINISNNTIIEELLDNLTIFASDKQKIPQIRYLATILTQSQAESITQIGKPVKHRRIHINKNGKKIITKNTTKHISL